MILAFSLGFKTHISIESWEPEGQSCLAYNPRDSWEIRSSTWEFLWLSSSPTQTYPSVCLPLLHGSSWPCCAINRSSFLPLSWTFHASLGSLGSAGRDFAEGTQSASGRLLWQYLSAFRSQRSMTCCSLQCARWSRLRLEAVLLMILPWGCLLKGWLRACYAWSRNWERTW